MTWLDLMWLPPLILAVAAVVGVAGRQEDLGRHIRRSFVALLLGVLAVGVVVRLLVVLFA